MKYIMILFLLSMAACAPMDPELKAHLDAERYFHAVQQYPDLDPDYIDDCLYYETMKCDFE